MQLRLVFLLGAISLAAVFTGCANPGIVKLSQDTYLLSRTDKGGIFGNASKMKANVIHEANEFAKSQGKVAIPVSMRDIPMQIGRFASFDYQFRLVDPSSPEVRPTNLVEKGSLCQWESKSVPISGIEKCTTHLHDGCSLSR